MRLPTVGGIPDVMATCDVIAVLSIDSYAINRQRFGPAYVLEADGPNVRWRRHEGLAVLVVNDEVSEAALLATLGQVPDPCVVLAMTQRPSVAVFNAIDAIRSEGRTCMVIGPRAAGCIAVPKRGTAIMINVHLGPGMDSSAVVEEIKL